MKQRIAYKTPFVRKCFLGCCSLGLTALKILFSFFTLIINHAHCMWFKDVHFISQKHRQFPKRFPITDKMFRLLSVKHRRSKQLRLSSNSFWNHSLLLQPSCFLYCHFLSANLLLEPASSLFRAVLHCLCVLSGCNGCSIPPEPALQPGQAPFLVPHFLLPLLALIWYKTFHRRTHSSG